MRNQGHTDICVDVTLNTNQKSTGTYIINFVRSTLNGLHRFYNRNAK